MTNAKMTSTEMARDFNAGAMNEIAASASTMAETLLVLAKQAHSFAETKDYINEAHDFKMLAHYARAIIARQ